MSKDVIKIKGAADGFQLMVDSSADLPQVREQLESKLLQHPEFFPEGTNFQVVTDNLSATVCSGLTSYLHDKGFNLIEAKRQKHVSGGNKNGDAANASEATVSLDKVISRTIRNGEEIVSHGSLMICGNVNPGAKLVAVGSIDVRGNCRGIVHAGAAGDYNAFVVADKLMPMQIRIANLIARSPDEMEAREYAEKACIKDGQIVIEPIER